MTPRHNGSQEPITGVSFNIGITQYTLGKKQKAKIYIYHFVRYEIEEHTQNSSLAHSISKQTIINKANRSINPVLKKTRPLLDRSLFFLSNPLEFQIKNP